MHLTDLLRLVPGMEVVMVSPALYSIIERINWTYENNSHQVLVDGRDIGQAFARAALLPDISGYLSLNIIGSASPQHKTVLQFIQQKLQQGISNPIAMPAAIALPAHKILGLVSYKRAIPVTTCTITASLTNPDMQNIKARQLLGYQPLISWQSSVDDFIAEYVRQNKETGLFIEEKDLLI